MNKLLMDPLYPSSCLTCNPSQWSLEVSGLVSTERWYFLWPKEKKKRSELSSPEGAKCTASSGVSLRSPKAPPPQGSLPLSVLKRRCSQLAPSPSRDSSARRGTSATRPDRRDAGGWWRRCPNTSRARTGEVLARGLPSLDHPRTGHKHSEFSEKPI